MTLNNRNAVLCTIVIAQFLCTSLWFAGNGVMQDLIEDFALSGSVLGHLTTGIQLGFIFGTLVFAIFRIADRYSPSKVFLLSAIAGSVVNVLMIIPSNSLMSLLSIRFITGFFLAGIYPVGMKIAADHFSRDLGKALGLLVGALVVGTALPHLIRSFGVDADWRYVIISISILSLAGGLLIGCFIKEGPYRTAGQGISVRALFHVFKVRQFSKPALGYFGHMWELYAFWAFVPVLIAAYQKNYPVHDYDISLLSFVIIAIGGLACVINGYLSNKIGTAKAAVSALIISGVCCVLSPLIFQQGSLVAFMLFMLVWGMSVVADSPMFSTLVSKEAPSDSRGTALTIVVCIGFAITIVSIQLLNWLSTIMESRYLFLFLIPGPVFGVLAMINSSKNQSIIDP